MFASIFKIVFLIVGILLAVAFLTVAERKIIASIQRRKGPNLVGFFGIFQALADGLKLLVKEIILPSSANAYLFLFAPVLTFFLSLLSWSVLPVGENVVFSDLNLGLFFILSVSSLSVYGIIIAGWSSNSKYAFLGALRSAAQIISYEVSISFLVLLVVIATGSINLMKIIKHQESLWLLFPFFNSFFIFFVSGLAETNRHPFDLPEAEAELVSGYNVEYSAMSFALFFLGEYANIVLISLLNTILFFGGPFVFFYSSSLLISVKVLFFIILFVWARAAFPRYRYDQLIRLGWKVFLPLVIGNVFLTAGVLFGFNCLPLYKMKSIIFLIFSFVIFLFGLFGVFLNKKSLLTILICIEVMLLSVNINFLLFSSIFDDVTGQTFALFVLTVAAVESAIGLAILVSFFRVNGNISSSTTTLLQT